jgi:hypothetical protein
MSNPSNNRIYAALQPISAWMVILGFALFLALSFLVGAGRFLILIFPLGSLAIGIFLYLRCPLLYTGFTWWMWFLGPLIRRIIDYQSGYLTYGPWTLTPLLVTSISSATLVKHLPTAHKLGGLPFLLSIGSLFYSFLIGLVENSANAVVNDLLAWLCPILFSFHLFVNWRDYPSYRENIKCTFLWGTLVMGIYGIWQYLVAPEWDRFWLINTGTNSFGKPEPLGIRVSSTLNSPQSFANVMMAGLLLLFANQGSLRFPAAGVGYLAFLLSIARSAWLGWLTGLTSFMLSLKSSLQIRLLITIAAAALFVMPLTTIEPFSTVITSRLETLSHAPEEDVSFQARAQGYSELLNLALSEFSGKGLGHVIVSDSIGRADSTILPMLFSLGWLGTIPYLGGLILLFLKLFQAPERRFEPFASCAFSIALGVFVQFGFNLITDGPIGMVLWGFLGIAIAAHKYYLYQHTMEREGD